MWNDGKFKIYEIEHQQKDGKWVKSNLDYFGYPSDFNASGECWQRTGVSGTFNLPMVRNGLNWIQKKNPNHRFRLVLVTITQKTEIVE